MKSLRKEQILAARTKKPTTILFIVVLLTLLLPSEHLITLKLKSSTLLYILLHVVPFIENNERSKNTHFLLFSNENVRGKDSG